jgi:predicted branched-subunit amino acid permease
MLDDDHTEHRRPASNITVAALRAAIALFIPAIPFGLVLGVAITDSAMPTAVAWSTNLAVFAGAAQLATVSLAATATWLTLVATAAVINLRHVMYSAALSPRFNDQPRWFRWVGPFFLIDQLFALVSVRTHMPGSDWRRFYLSAGVFYFVSWITVVTLGLAVGSSIPTEWRLDVAPAIMFAGLVVMGLVNRPARHR